MWTKQHEFEGIPGKPCLKCGRVHTKFSYEGELSHGPAKVDQSGSVAGSVDNRDVLIDYIVRYASVSVKLYRSLMHTEEYKILTAEMIKRGILKST